MRVVLSLCILLLGCQWLLAQQDTISAVEYIGIKRTRTSYLERFIYTRPGQELDSIRLDADVQRLYNTTFFINVDYKVTDTPEGKKVVYNIEEVWTLLPIVNFGGIRNNFWFELGAVDIHFMGTGTSFGGFYRYFDRHNVVAWYRTPYIAGSSWGAAINFTRNATLEPLYFKDTTLRYYYDNYSVEVLGRYEFYFGNFIQAGGIFLNELYRRKDNIDLGAETPERLTVNKYGFRILHTLQHVNFFYQYLDGIQNNWTSEVIHTPSKQEFFWKLMNETSYYKRVRKRANIAARLRMGISSNADSPFAPFVLDSYINIRGSGNRVFRGTSEFVLNVEWRQTLYENNLGAIGTVLFMDGGGWRPAGDPFKATFDRVNMKAFGGAGVRLYIKKIYNLILRFDYAFNLADWKMHGPVIGVGQYF